MRMPLHVRILIGAVVGVVAGGLAYNFWGETEGLKGVIEYGTRPVGTVFLRLLFMLVAPLMFSALVLGVSELGDLRRLGRIGVKTLAYTVIVSFIAVMIGIALVNTLKPGEGIPQDMQERLLEDAEQRFQGSTVSRTLPSSPVELLVRIVPDNAIKALAEGDYLAWMFFALMIGIAMCMVRTPAAEALRQTLAGVYDVSMWLIGFVIQLAPIGVAALLFNLTAEFGWDVLVQLARYVGVVLVGLLIHQFIVYSLAVKALGGMSPVRFFRGSQEAIITAFSTASSNATLPTALKVAEENLKLPQHVSRFVLTIGATANQNGTALFEGVTVLFLAQFYGIELNLGQQIIVVMMCVLGGIGTAGVPAGSIPVVMIILEMVGVPPEGIGLILGVDRFLDMCRTTLNVTGDLAAAVVVSRGEEHVHDTRPPLSL